MKRIPLALVAALPLAAFPLAAAPALAAPAPQAAKSTASSFSVTLKEQNGTGAKGLAILSIEGNRLTINLKAQGLSPNSVHVAHVHGTFEKGKFRCGTAADDKNKDGVVSTMEGAPHTGAAGISLTTRGDTSGSSGLAVDRFPTADAKGNLSYQRTFTVPEKWIANFSQLLIIQHGVDFNDNGSYDFGKGKSDLSPALPEEATAPATCGTIDTAAIKLIPKGGVETGGDGPAQLPLYALLGASALAAAGAIGFALRRQRPMTISS